MRAGGVTLHVVALLPWFHVLVFGAFVARACAALGYWPSFNHPDPKRLGFVMHHFAVSDVDANEAVAVATAAG